MGLDMFLFRKTGEGEEGKEQLAYWRKANQVHAWFVDNVQDGEDDGQAYPVTREQLRRLRDLCQHVLEHPEEAQEKLPTRAGFFFGSTEYDDWYFEDLRSTVKQLDEVLERTNDQDQILYWAWW